MRPTAPVQRVVLIAAGLLLLAPGTIQDAMGLALFAAVAAWQFATRPRHAV